MSATNEIMSWVHVRELFEASKSITGYYDYYKIFDTQELIFKTKETEALMKFFLTQPIQVASAVTDVSITFKRSNIIDFLSLMYDKTTEEDRNGFSWNTYINLLSPITPQHLSCQYILKSNAIAPYKRNASDECYDLHLIEIDKIISDDTTRFDTGVIVLPPFGYHVEIIARSSLSNHGFILTNSVGMIDTSYTGTIKVTLTNVSKKEHPLVLPFRGIQMYIRPNVHFIVKEVTEATRTLRGEGGFGSTG